MKAYLHIFLLLTFACTPESPKPDQQSRDLIWLEHAGAQMPVWVEGNTISNVMVIILHGGPGGNALIYNETSITMATELEERYGVAYWDQRISGNSRGSFDEKEVSVELMAEDLDLLIDLLQELYGPTLDIFLLGHSWGGYLGSYYLLDPERQAKVRGWIDVDGAHNIPSLTRDALELMEEVSRAQIGADVDSREKWEDILAFVEGFSLGNVIDTDDFVEVNLQAIEAEKLAFSDGLTAEGEEDPNELLKGLLSYFFGKHHPLTALTNRIQINQTQILDEAIANPLSDQLLRITTPSLLLWGKLDFVVPPNQGLDAYNNLGTPDNQKTLVIFEESGHSPMSNEPDLFVDIVVGFIEGLR
ncbi:MAG: alpha/beta hydrolase [Bacteroidota bacterium]